MQNEMQRLPHLLIVQPWARYLITWCHSSFIRKMLLKNVVISASWVFVANDIIVAFRTPRNLIYNYSIDDNFNSSLWSFSIYISWTLHFWILPSVAPFSILNMNLFLSSKYCLFCSLTLIPAVMSSIQFVMASKHIIGHFELPILILSFCLSGIFSKNSWAFRILPFIWLIDLFLSIHDSNSKCLWIINHNIPS